MLYIHTCGSSSSLARAHTHSHLNMNIFPNVNSHFWHVHNLRMVLPYSKFQLNMVDLVNVNRASSKIAVELVNNANFKREPPHIINDRTIQMITDIFNNTFVIATCGNNSHKWKHHTLVSHFSIYIILENSYIELDKYVWMNNDGLRKMLPEHLICNFRLRFGRLKKKWKEVRFVALLLQRLFRPNNATIKMNMRSNTC